MKKGLLLAALVVMPIFAVIYATEQTVLTGIIRGLEEDEDGNAVSVYLESDDEIVYIAPQGKGVELNNHVGKRVEIQGVLSKDSDGDSLITITSYKLLSD